MRLLDESQEGPPSDDEMELPESNILNPYGIIGAGGSVYEANLNRLKQEALNFRSSFCSARKDTGANFLYLISSDLDREQFAKP
jgi:hypothetical protein